MSSNQVVSTKLWTKVFNLSQADLKDMPQTNNLSHTVTHIHTPSVSPFHTHTHSAYNVNNS